MVSPGQDLAVIESKGYILGRISSIQHDNHWDDGQGVDVTWRHTPGAMEDIRGRTSHWNLQSSAKSIMIGDVICLFRGASNPTVIRFREDYGDIILIATTPPQSVHTTHVDIDWSRYLKMAEVFTVRDLECVWNWEDSPVTWQNKREPEVWERYRDKIVRSFNSVLILGDVGDHKEAEKKFQEAMRGYETWSRNEHLQALLSDRLSLLMDSNLDCRRYIQPLLYWAVKRGYAAVVELLLNMDKTLACPADESGHTPLVLAARGGHLAVVEVLLQKGADVNSAAVAVYGRTALQAAAEEGHFMVVEQLIQANADVNAEGAYKGTALELAKEGGNDFVAERLRQAGAKESYD